MTIYRLVKFWNKFVNYQYDKIQYSVWAPKSLGALWAPLGYIKLYGLDCSVFSGVRVRKFESRIYMDLIFRCFQGVRVQKVESRFYIGRIFRCFQGVRVRKVESRFTWTLFFGVFEGQKAAFLGLFRCFNDTELKRVKSLTLFPPV